MWEDLGANILKLEDGTTGFSNKKMTGNGFLWTKNCGLSKAGLITQWS